MDRFCDLHTHSIHSDGTLTPTVLIDRAIDCGLSALALTDHNTITGLTEFINAAEGKPIDIAPGVEFTTVDNGNELHILGLFVRPDMFKGINEYINRVTILKEQSNYRLVQKLQERGYDISYVDILENSKGYVNRANIAAELLRKGYIGSIKEGFDTLLSESYGLYEPPERLASIETIRFIRSIGAVAVWAHPYLSMNAEQVDEFLPRAVEAGLQGMEVLYSTYDEETTAHAKATCARFGLLESGGSDFHGDNKPHISLGTGTGSLRIPYAYYEALRALA